MRIIRALGLRNLFIILGSVSFGVTGQLILKSGANRIGEVQLSWAGLAHLFASMFQEPLILLGYPFFIAGSMLWLVVLSRLDLSHAYPFLGIHYLVVTLMSWLVLHEAVGVGRWLAVMLIVAGILVVGQSEVIKQNKKDPGAESLSAEDPSSVSPNETLVGQEA